MDPGRRLDKVLTQSPSPHEFIIELNYAHTVHAIYYLNIHSSVAQETPALIEQLTLQSAKRHRKTRCAGQKQMSDDLQVN